MSSDKPTYLGIFPCRKLTLARKSWYYQCAPVVAGPTTGGCLHDWYFTQTKWVNLVKRYLELETNCQKPYFDNPTLNYHTHIYISWLGYSPKLGMSKSKRTMWTSNCFPWNVSMILCLLWLLLNKAVGYFFAKNDSVLLVEAMCLHHPQFSSGSKVHKGARLKPRVRGSRLSGVGPCKVPRLPRLGWLGCQDMGAISRDLRLTMRK